MRYHKECIIVPMYRGTSFLHTNGDRQTSEKGFGDISWRYFDRCLPSLGVCRENRLQNSSEGVCHTSEVLSVLRCTVLY